MINFDDMKLNEEIWKAAEQNQGDTIAYVLKELPPPKNIFPNNEYKDAVSGGICYMLGTEWLRLIMTGEPRTRWADEYGMLTDVKTKKGKAYYKQIMDNFYEYVSGRVPGEQIKRALFETLMNRHPNSIFELDSLLCKLCIGNNINVTNGGIHTGEGNMETWMVDKLVCNEKYMNITCFWDTDEGERAGHRMTAYRESDTSLYFYDPNIGVIFVSGDSVQNLKDKLTFLLIHIKNGYKFTNGAFCVTYLQ